MNKRWFEHGSATLISTDRNIDNIYIQILSARTLPCGKSSAGVFEKTLEVTEMKNVVLIIAVTLFAGIAVAQNVSTSLYVQKEYTGVGVGVSGKDGCIYYERGTDGYNLLVVKANVGDGKVVLRQDADIWTRLGAQFNVGGGKSTTTILALPGLGDAPTWVDVFTPCVPVAKNLTAAGHVRLKEGGSNDWWFGPTYTNGRFDAYYHYNFREGGSYEGGIDYQIDW